MRRSRDDRPYRAHGWARGLIHFHSRFSDGWPTVRRAAKIAKKRGFDFLIVTDHIRNLKLFTHRTLEEYVRACDRATQAVGIPVIPGGEMEVHWDNKAIADFSEGHTIAFSIRPLVAASVFDWTTKKADPFAFWTDSRGRQGSLRAIQEMLLRYGVPPAASHQFQHSPLGRGPEGYSDYRYDLSELELVRYLDFFYSGAVDLIHESEDLELITDAVQTLPDQAKAVYASADYHVGPETLPAVADALERLPALRRVYGWLFRNFAAMALRFLGDPESMAFPFFAEEQLTHATYVYLGDRPCTEETVLEALARGRTCVSRGHFVFKTLLPAPTFTRITTTGVQIYFSAPVSYSKPRPRSLLLFRDGKLVDWRIYTPKVEEIEFTYVDRTLAPGTYLYQLYVPSKFLSSPMIVSVPAAP